jgi:mRNA interferase MazF
VVVGRGDIWWADLGEPRGSEPGYRRPVLVVQNDAFNASRIRTIVVVGLTTNLQRLDAPGNVLIPSKISGLSRDSVANVSQIMTLDRDEMAERIGRVSADVLKAVERGLRLVLDL